MKTEEKKEKQMNKKRRGGDVNDAVFTAGVSSSLPQSLPFFSHFFPSPSQLMPATQVR